MNLCAFTSVCEEDRTWIPQYLMEVDRLRIDFAMHFDRCSPTTKAMVQTHPRCCGTTEQDDPRIEFTENAKQPILDLVAAEDYDWAMAWDIDETYEREAPGKLAKLWMPDFKYHSCCVDVKWVNLWGDKNHIRVDGPFSQGHRVKFYNLRAGIWKFTNKTTNGPKVHNAAGNTIRGETATWHEFVSLHWGMMTLEMREQHKARWDRIYTAAVGSNPYGFWNFALDTVNYPPTISPNPYL